jgi:hypothetical protein
LTSGNPNLPEVDAFLHLTIISSIHHNRPIDMDKASRALAEGLPPNLPLSWRALADYHGVAHSTDYHRSKGRRALKRKGQDQQYLTPWEEDALVKFVLQMARTGFPMRIKTLPALAHRLSKVRYPERVETLTHFELVKDWHAIRWCKYHEQSHIEWFKTSDKMVSQVAKAWISWMERANPYDRRGYLKRHWREILDFLSEYEIIVTAELMVQIHEIEEGTISVASFLEDDLLRQERLGLGCVYVKQEEK